MPDQPVLLTLEPVSCWQCSDPVSSERPSKFCSDQCARRYWGTEGDAAQALPVLDDTFSA